MVRKVPRVALGPQEILAHLAQLVKRESLAFQGCRDTQEDKAQKVRLDSQDSREQMARKE